MARLRGPYAALGLSAVLVLGCSLQVGAQDHGEAHRRWLPCDVSWAVGDHDHTSPDFTVRVHYRQQPVASVKVRLTSEEAEGQAADGRVVATADTDSDGNAHFFAIPPGLYEARVDAGLQAPRRDVEVEARLRRPAAVDLEWPSWPIVAQTAQGKISVWAQPLPEQDAVRRPFPFVDVELLDLRTARLLAVSRTDEGGNYVFPGVGDGLYVLRVDAGSNADMHEFERAIEIRLHAKRLRMPELQADKVCGGGLEEIVPRGPPLP